MKNKFTFKKVYLLSLVPLLSTALYLVSMIFCSDAILYFAEYGFTPAVYLALAILIGVIVLWAYCGVLFSRSNTKIGVSVLIANAIPILTTLIFMVLYIIYKYSGSEALFTVAELIGCLGTGAFGILSEVAYMLFSVSTLMQIFISFVACILVFMMGYAIGGPVEGKKKDKAAIAAELERDRQRKEQRKAQRRKK
ncbi:MAG: hypothetical protein IKM00_10700 [Clostridia bacterium]|nr:hypothetical protein [Clostridia bacterium]MBR6745663.1 hypothetical protein [Clostridia bacterium]